MVSKTQGFTLYFSNATSAPNCNTTSREIISDNLLVYPIPAKESITLSRETEQFAKAIITDMQGIVLLQTEINSKEATIDVSKLNAGIYIILLETKYGFEKTLITHDHLELIHRIKKYSDINLGKTHNKFLQLLSNFYRATRYDRFGVSSVYHPNQDKEQLIKFVSDELNIEISAGMMFPTEIDERIRKFIGKTISTIATKLYDIINDRARELNIYTYEIDYNSKAFKIFIEKGYS
ncbi:MAG: T9SS type A sorting domain-containing protein, partial [Flavobacterium sp.]|nr:T9SS type A sorting domain-containing protein [Flavobacterium sp.]